MQKKLVPAVIFLLAALISQRALGEEIVLTPRTQPGSGDATRAVRFLFQNDLAEKSTDAVKRVVFPKGRYDFYPDYANERYVFVSNNDEGLKRIVFLWEDLKNIEFDGQGSEFVFHGYTCPFVLDRCENVTFKNFSIDWERTFHSEGEILAVADDYFDVRFSEAYPYKIDSGMLIFTGRGDDKATYPFGGLLEFDAEKRETAFLAWDYWVPEPGTLPAEDLGDRKVRVHRKGVKAAVGNIMVFGPNHRKVPLFTLSDCTDVRFENVLMYHSGGMGVIAQRCTNVELHRCKTTPAPGKNRVVSLTADATHFVNCHGKIVLNECVFENQKDDATNVHGIYAKIVAKSTVMVSGRDEHGNPAVLDYDVIDVRFIHLQQLGFDFIKAGTQLEFVDAESMNLIHVTFPVVRSATRINKEITRVELQSILPDAVKLGDAVCDATTAPEVTITKCYIGKNRARGVLLNSRGKTVIEGNTFHTPGAAILLEGDARYWFEQAGVRDLQIRDNVFDNCNYGVWGWAVIETRPGIEPSRRAESRYNKNVVIENNVFKIFDNRILNFYSTDGLTFRNNTIESSTAYPPQHQDAKRFVVEHCDNVQVDE